jgi:hypothetical protein
MAYNITLSNGDALITGGLVDGTIDTTSSSLTLVGKNYPGYGVFLNQNMIRLSENFAKSSAPTSPLPGQLWWDSTFGVLKIYYADTDTSQWVDATPVLGSSGGGSSTKRSYVMSFGAGFTPSTGADTISIQMPYAPDNSSQYYYIKRLDYRAETAGTGVSFFIERHTAGNSSFTAANRIHSGAGASFVASSGTFTTSYTLSSTGASFVSSSGIAGSVISGDYLRLNFSHINSAANMSISMVIEEQ